MDFIIFLRQTINIFADLLVLAIFLRVILSWFHHQAGGLTNLLYQLTEPLLGPLRRSLPAFGVFDLSPLVAIFLIELLRSLLNRYL